MEELVAAFRARLVVPSGWMECAAVGDPVQTPGFGAGFLPMKVPLSEEFSDEKLCQTPVSADQVCYVTLVSSSYTNITIKQY